MIENSALFRVEALATSKAKWLGDTILVRPLSFTLLTATALGMGVAILCFLIFGSYTKRVQLTGQLIPARGLVKVFSPQSGVILEKHIAEGQQVEKGQTLFVLSSERRSSTLGDTQLAVSGQLRQRLASLREELDKTRDVHAAELKRLSDRIDRMRRELGEVGTQVRNQKRRVAIAADIVSRYRGLLQEQYISKDQLLDKQADFLDQSARLQALERERANLAQELAARESEWRALPLKHENLQAQIRRSLGGTEQELSESEARRSIVVTAPHAGIATGVVAEAGHVVDGSRALLSVVPLQAQLHAHLYAPSHAIGFTKAGDTVLLRYQAFPYQKFGQHRGVVVSVSRTALPVSELAFVSGGGSIPGIDPNQAQALYYRIQVALSAQSVQAYGQEQHLQPGMVVEAHVLQETRRIYEWTLDPLYSLKGRLGT